MSFRSCLGRTVTLFALPRSHRSPKHLPEHAVVTLWESSTSDSRSPEGNSDLLGTRWDLVPACFAQTPTPGAPGLGFGLRTAPGGAFGPRRGFQSLGIARGGPNTPYRKRAPLRVAASMKARRLSNDFLPSFLRRTPVGFVWPRSSIRASVRGCTAGA